MIKKIIMVIFLSLFLAELLVRLYFVQISPLPQQIIKQSFYTSLKEFVPNSEGKQRGVFYKINSLGFRGDQPKEVTENLFKIIILGDSTSFGLDVEQTKSYPALLETGLNNLKSEREFEVINASAPGLGTAAQLDIFQERLKSLSPNLVILAFFPNDLMDNQVYLREKALLEDDSLKGKFKKVLHWRGKLKFYQLITNFALGFTKRGKTGGDWTLSAVSGKGIAEDLFLKEEELILQFKETVETGGGRFLLLYLPTQREINKESFVNNWLKNFCLEEKILFLDIGEIYEKKDNWEQFYLPNDLGHPGELGHEIIAEEIKILLINKKIF